MLKFITVLAILFALAAFGRDVAPQGRAEPKSPYSGFLVKFKRFDPRGQDAIHRVAGTVLAYRSQKQRIDAVKLSDPVKNEDKAALEKTCQAYRVHPEVEGCELGVKLKPAAAGGASQPAGSEPCPNAGTAGSPRVLDDTFIKAITAYIDCDPFEPEDVNYARLPMATDEYGALSPFWAQEATGSDLAAAALDEWDRTHSAKTAPVPTGIIDGGIELAHVVPQSRLSPELQACRAKPASCEAIAADPHGTSVANLIIGPPPEGTGSRARLTRIQQGETTADLIRANDRFTEGPDQPKVVNMSMACQTEEGCKDFAVESLDGLASRAVLVKAEGNEFPQRPTDPARMKDAFFVGSTAPDGLLSGFSSEGPEVLVTAPSDHYVASINSATDPRHQDRTITKTGNFSGTSGAAPQVTGAITNVLSLLPNMTKPELRELIRATAVRTAAYRPGNGKNGAGQLNAYKMAKVAMRLKERGWPADRSAVTDAALYEFPDEAASLRADAIKELKTQSCAAARRASTLLRRSFLLDPENNDTRALLARLYDEAGYHAQAQLYRRTPAAEIIASLRTPTARLQEAIRNGVITPRTYEDFAGITDLFERQPAILFVLTQGPAGVRPFIDAALRAGNNDLLGELAYWGLRLRTTDKDTLFAVARELYRSSDYRIRQTAVFAVANNGAFPAEQRREIFSWAAHDPNANLRSNLLFETREFFPDRDECLKAIDSISQEGFEQLVRHGDVPRARELCGKKAE